MTITLVNAGMTRNVDVPLGSTAGDIRNLHDDLEEVGAPSTFSLSINGTQVGDDAVLTPGARVAFRPDTSGKGMR